MSDIVGGKAISLVQRGGIVEKPHARTFVAESSNGGSYTVTFGTRPADAVPRYECTCPASGRCYHGDAAALLMAKQREEAQHEEQHEMEAERAEEARGEAILAETDAVMREWHWDWDRDRTRIFEEAERRVDARALAEPPEGFVLRKPRRLSPATLKARPASTWRYGLAFLREHGAAEGWIVPPKGSPFSGGDVTALIDRGMLLVADKGSAKRYRIPPPGYRPPR